MDSMDDKDKNNNGIPGDAEVFAWIFSFIVILAIISAILGKITGLFNRVEIGGTSIQIFSDLFASNYLPLIRIMSVALSVALIVFIIYVTRETNKILVEERRKIRGEERMAIPGYFGTKEQSQEVEQFEFQNKRWEKVIKLINSKSSADWKLAILESDILLGEMLDKMGYRGESIGEQLKQIEKSDFTSLDSAWEAHKIRNSIAHEGEEFLITHREASRVIRLFEEVFLEFRYV